MRGHLGGRPPRTAPDDGGPSTAINQNEAYPSADGFARNYWGIEAGLAIRQLARNGGYVDAEMVLDLIGEPPHSAYVGVAFAAAQRSKVIEPIGARLGRDSRLIRVWFRAAAVTR